MPIERNRIRLPIESIEVNRSQAKWLNSIIESIERIDRSNRSQKKCKLIRLASIDIRLHSIDSINSVFDWFNNRIQSNQSKKNVKIRLTSIASINSFDWFDNQIQSLRLIGFDWFNNRILRLASPEYVYSSEWDLALM